MVIKKAEMSWGVGIKKKSDTMVRLGRDDLSWVQCAEQFSVTSVHQDYQAVWYSIKARFDGQKSRIP